MQQTPLIHVVSDIHLEVSPYTLSPPPDTDILVCAGDIGIGLRGLQWAAAWGLPVIYVPGNHEFDGFDVRALSQQLHDEAGKYRDVHVLQAEGATVQGVRFLGATLWTDFAYFGEQTRQDVMSFCQRSMPEYATVLHHGRLLKASDTYDWHVQERQWLHWALAQPYADNTLQETVVVTHHAPHAKSVAPRYQCQALTAAFASNCEELLGRGGLWLHGHMHTNFDYNVEGTRIICNPRGYTTQVNAHQTSFDPTLLVRADGTL